RSIYPSIWHISSGMRSHRCGGGICLVRMERKKKYEDTECPQALLQRHSAPSGSGSPPGLPGRVASELRTEQERCRSATLTAGGPSCLLGTPFGEPREREW